MTQLSINTNQSRLPGLDLLRAGAVILVFFCHYIPNGSPSWVLKIGKFGWIGVDLFFVLSGYLIGKQLLTDLDAKNSISFRTFYIKRFFRILPAYFTVLVLYYSVPYFREFESLAPAWRFLTFTHNLNLNVTEYGAFSHSWSLCVEEHFYLLLPITIFLVNYYKKNDKTAYIIIALFVLGYILRAASWFMFVSPTLEPVNTTGMRPIIAILKYIYYPTPTRLEGLLIGLGIAIIFQYKPNIASFIGRYANLIFLAGLLLLAACYFITIKTVSFHAQVTCYSLLALSFGFFVASALIKNSLLDRMRFNLFSYMAAISYSFYLIHRQVIHMVQDSLSFLGLPPESNFIFFICLISSIVAASIMYAVIERPFMLLRNRVLRYYGEEKTE